MSLYALACAPAYFQWGRKEARAMLGKEVREELGSAVWEEVRREAHMRRG
jgi:hypothetical protein